MKFSQSEHKFENISAKSQAKETKSARFLSTAFSLMSAPSPTTPLSNGHSPPQIICKQCQFCALNLAADRSDGYKFLALNRVIHAICCKGTEFSLHKPHKNPFEDIDELDIQDATPAIIQIDEDFDSKDIDQI